MVTAVSSTKAARSLGFLPLTVSESIKNKSCLEHEYGYYMKKELILCKNRKREKSMQTFLEIFMLRIVL